MENSRDYKSGMIKGAVWLAASGLIVKLLGLLYKIPLSYVLTDEGMGYFNSAYTVYTFFYLICSAGIPKAISILTSSAISDGSDEKVREIYKTAMLIFSALGVAITVIFLLSAKPISVFIGNTGAYFTMIAIAPSIFFTCISGVLRGYFNGAMRFAPIAVSEACSAIGKTLLGLGFAWLGCKFNNSLEIVSAMTILGTTVGSFLGFAYLAMCKRSEKKNVKTKQKKFFSFGSPKITKELFKLSIPITLTAAIGSISSIVDLTVIMRRLQNIGFSEFQSGVIYGNYTTLVIPMLNLIGTLVVPLTSVLLPFVSKKSTEAVFEMISERISFIIRILFFFIVPATVIFLFRSREVLMILFEDSSAVMAAPLLVMLAPSMIFMPLTAVVNTSLEGMGDTRIPLISLLSGALIKCILTIVLIGNDNFEILGAPFSTGFSYMISFLISFCYIKFAKGVNIKIVRYVISPCFSAVTAIMLCEALKRIYFAEITAYYTLELCFFAVIYLFLMSVFNFKYLRLYFFGKTNKITQKVLYK